jgi:hypothetical protein
LWPFALVILLSCDSFLHSQLLLLLLLLLLLVIVLVRNNQSIKASDFVVISF